MDTLFWCCRFTCKSEMIAEQVAGCDACFLLDNNEDDDKLELLVH